MSTRTPLASVVIPTHDRRRSLCRTLTALGNQTLPSELFEIVVAADGCVDGTVESVRGLACRSELRVLDLPAGGAAAARNAGAAAARGALLIFLDDDIDVAPGFIAAHLKAHGVGEGRPVDGEPLPLRVAIGYLPALLQPEQDFFAMALRGWWEGMFDSIREPGHRFTYRDLLTGNFSMPREHFVRLGNFDERYGCHEDYELGYRLILAGAEFVFADQAWGFHRDLTRLDRACSRKRAEGRADVQLAIQYPELRSCLPLAQRRSRKHRLARRIAFGIPRAGDRLILFIGHFLRVLEKIGARSSWQRVLNWILGYWYERGLADAAGTLVALRPLIDPEAPRLSPTAPVHLDVTDLEAAERQLDEQRPAAVTLCAGSRPFGRFVSDPGAERVAGRHLRPALARIWYRAYVEALLAENRLTVLSAGREPAPPPDTDSVAVDSIGLVAAPARPRSGR